MAGRKRPGREYGWSGAGCRLYRGVADTLRNTVPPEWRMPGARRTLPFLIAASLAAWLSLPGPAGAQGSGRQNFLIELDGSIAEFVMYCTLVDGDVRQQVKRRAYLPKSYRIQAQAVSCTVTMLDFRGRLNGRLYAQDGRLIASIEQIAVRPVVRLRSEGPWGAARGTRSAMAISPSRRPESPTGRRDPVPPSAIPTMPRRPHRRRRRAPVDVCPSPRVAPLARAFARFPATRCGRLFRQPRREKTGLFQKKSFGTQQEHKKNIPLIIG